MVILVGTLLALETCKLPYCFRISSGLRFVKVVSDHDSREYIEDDHVYTCVDVDYVTAMLGGKVG